MNEGLLIYSNFDVDNLPKLEKVFNNLLGSGKFSYISVSLKNKWQLIFNLPFFVLSLLFKVLGKKFIVTTEDSLIGFLSVLMAFFNSKKSILVLDSDNLWESFVERSSFFIPIRDFYRILPTLNFYEQAILFFNKFICNYADHLVFLDKEMAEIWSNFYGFSKEKALIIKSNKAKIKKKQK